MTTSAQILMRARDKGLRLAFAESCTGGLLSAEITNEPGSSDIFECGYVTYSNTSKRDTLGVDYAVIAADGAVSEKVAAQMAEGALSRSGADIALAVTGIAGPGGSDNKPEGRVCFGLARNGAKTRVQTVEFGALGRENVRHAAVAHAMSMLGQEIS